MPGFPGFFDRILSGFCLAARAHEAQDKGDIRG